MPCGDRGARPLRARVEGSESMSEAAASVAPQGEQDAPVPLDREPEQTDGASRTAPGRAGRRPPGRARAKRARAAAPAGLDRAAIHAVPAGPLERAGRLIGRVLVGEAERQERALDEQLRR